jgi:hypothetical protein
MSAFSTGMSQRQRRKGFVQLQSRRRPTDTTTFWRSEVTGCLGSRYALPPLVTLHDLTSDSVFAIQKCDPAPFYLFDEVSRGFQIAVTKVSTGHIIVCRSTQI